MGVGIEPRHHDDVPRVLLFWFVVLGATSRADEPIDHAERSHEAARDRASNPDPSAHLSSEDEAARVGATRGPEVQAALAARHGADGLRGASGSLLHAPVLSAQLGYRHSAQGSGPEVTATVTQEIPMRGVGSQRRKLASATTDALEMALESARGRGARRAALAFIATVEAQALLALRDRALEDAERLAQLSRRRVEVGTAQPVEAALGEGERGRAKAAHIEAEGTLTEAAAELAIAVGRDPSEPPGTPSSFAVAPPVVEMTPAMLRGLVEHNPEVRLATVRLRAVEAQVGVARASGYSTVVAGASYQREGNGDEVGVGVINLGLPFFDPTRFDVAEKQLDVAAMQASTLLLRADVHKELHLARHDTEHYLELFDEVNKSGVLPAREAVRLADKAYLTGTDTLSSLLLARQRLVSAEEQAIHARAELARAHVRLAYAAGRLGDRP